MIRFIVTVAMAALVSSAALSTAVAATVTIPVLVRADDQRLDPRRLERAYLGQPGGPAVDGLMLGSEDAAFELDAAKIQIKWLPVPVASVDEARSVAAKQAQSGAPLLIVDLPAAWQLSVADATKLPVLNISDGSDSLRQADCRANLFHTIPSERMRADAMGQILLARRWQKVVLLTSASQQDKDRADVAEKAVKRYGLKLVARKEYKLSADPRERQMANASLLTSGLEYDALWVIDSDGEFSRSLPYRLSLPRPVVGDAGLVTVAWHSQFERYGAPQVSRSFAKRFKRSMTSHDWASWIAGKMTAQLLIAANFGSPKAKAADFYKALLATDFSIDGGKGRVVSFRLWDRQLRQPLLVTDGQGVIDIVPLDGVMHPSSALDTLGADAPEKLCKAAS